MHINTIQTECSLLNTVQKALQNGSKSQSKSACPQSRTSAFGMQYSKSFMEIEY